MVEVYRTDKTFREATLSVLLTFCVVYLVGVLVAAAVGAPMTFSVAVVVIATALAGAVLDIEVSY